nr:unnamed protein product [Digitaria exilis]
MHPNRRNPPCRYGRFVRRRISSASARRASYSRSCADLRRPPLAAPELLVAGDGDGDGLLFGAADGDGEVAGTGAAVGRWWVLPPSDLLRWRRSLRNPRAQRREPPREEEEDEVVEAEDAVEEDDDERNAAGVTAGSSADSVSGAGDGDAAAAAAGDLRQWERNGDKDLAFRRTERPRKRPRSSRSRPPSSSSAAAAEAAVVLEPGEDGGWRRAAESRTGRIWPLQKSSSAEDMAAAEGDGKREEKSKSKSRTPPKSLPAPPPRVGLAGAL